MARLQHDDVLISSKWMPPKTSHFSFQGLPSRKMDSKKRWAAIMQGYELTKLQWRPVGRSRTWSATAEQACQSTFDGPTWTISFFKPNASKRDLIWSNLPREAITRCRFGSLFLFSFSTSHEDLRHSDCMRRREMATIWVPLCVCLSATGSRFSVRSDTSKNINLRESSQCQFLEIQVDFELSFDF